jgi:hypothetical protein
VGGWEGEEWGYGELHTFTSGARKGEENSGLKVYLGRVVAEKGLLMRGKGRGFFLRMQGVEMLV